MEHDNISEKFSYDNIRKLAKIGTLFSRHPFLGSHAKAVAEKVIQLGAGRETARCGYCLIAVFRMFKQHSLGCLQAYVGKPYTECGVKPLLKIVGKVAAAYADTRRKSH